jgi:signal transduction histidine kinase
MTGSSNLTEQSSIGFTGVKDLTPPILLRRWRINLDYFFVFATFGTLLGLFIEPGPGASFREYLLWLTARGLSMALLYPLWLVTVKILDKFHLSPMPLWQILAIGAVGGALQSVLIEIFIWLFLLPNDSSSTARMLSAALFASIWLPAQSVTVINFTKFRRMRFSIQEQMLQLETVDQARGRLIKLDEEILRKQIADLVGKSQEEASLVLAGAIKNDSKVSLPDVTRGLASEQLRLLAHHISTLRVSTETKRHWWVVEQRFSTSISDAAFKSIRTRPLNKEWFLLVLIATVSLPLFRQREPIVALSVLAVIAIATYLIHWIGFLLYSVFTRTRMLITLFITLSTILIPISLFQFIPGNIPTQRNEIAYAISVLLVTIFGHLAQAGLLQQKELLEIEGTALHRAKTENAKINLELARITKDWAQHIHGNIQSRLHAFALVLEQAQLRDDTEAVERAIEEISRTIKDLDREQSQTAILPLEDEVVATCGLWDGIVDISIEVQEDLRTLKQPIVSEISQCLIEAMTNSVRHGHADRMSISIIEKNNTITVEIKDNGIGFTKIVNGLGSNTFETSTRNNWDLTRNASNTETTLTLNFDLEVPRVGVEPTLGGF